MAITAPDNLAAHRAVDGFKHEVYRLVNASRRPIDPRYRNQLFGTVEDAAADLARSFAGQGPEVQGRALRSSLAALTAARLRLRAGIGRKYFTPAECETALQLWYRANDIARALLACVEPSASARRRA